MVIERINTTIENVNRVGDTAIVTLVMDTKGAMLDTPIEGRFRYLRVWKKSGANYKVIAGSCIAL